MGRPMGRPFRILHLADIHGDSESLKAALERGKEWGADLAAIAGDINKWPLSDPEDRLYAKGGPKEDCAEFYRRVNGRADRNYAEIGEIMDGSGILWAGVSGNHDLNTKANNFIKKSGAGPFSSHSVHGEIVDAGGMRLGGYGGSFGGGCGMMVSCSEKECEDFLYSAEPDILLTHYPPYGMLDFASDGSCENLGIPAVARYVREKQPVLVMSGHVHEDKGAIKEGETVIVNPGNLGRFWKVDRETCERTNFPGYGSFAEITLEDGLVRAVSICSVEAGGPAVIKEYRF